MPQLPTFGLIAEGPTDHAVLENILVGYFGDENLTQNIRPLQPLRDATDAAQTHGGWQRVVEFCRSSHFQEAFVANDFLIVQIDTDRLHEPPFDLKKSSPETDVLAVCETFKSLIFNRFGEKFWTDFQSRIIFGVSVNTIECWLLPLFFLERTAAARTQNCLFKLNEHLAKAKKPTIPHDKSGWQKMYDRLSSDFCKPKILNLAAPKNPSLKIFVEKLAVSKPAD